jgi:hypothetical protein
VTFTSLADTPGTFIFTIVPRFVSLVCTCLPLQDVVVESARFSCCDCCPRGTEEEEKEEFEGNTESTASKNMSSNSAASEASKTWNGRKEVVNIMFTFDVF